MRVKVTGMAGLLALAGSAPAQTPASGEILRDLEQLQVVGSVLYVGAHPDDENTRLLHWLAARRGLRTAYLSMTRGGGGQNLIGTEQSELLGVVRTGELLAAREIDGAEQRFTRARDFGYSKSPEEALAIWGHDEALSDVVLAIRTFRPDVVLTRFDVEGGGGHGHHTASALLAGEAFALAADPAYLTPGAGPWQVDRMLRNQSAWRLPDDFDPASWPSVDVGAYDPLTGLSVGEVAAASRTMHKSQGMGSAPEVGALPEYFEAIAGTPVMPGDDLLVGLDTSWSRFEGGAPVSRALARAARRFDPRSPADSLADLALVHARMEGVADSHWRAFELGQLEQLMLDCAGVSLTARAVVPAVAPGGETTVNLRAVGRSAARPVLKAVRLGGQGIEVGQQLDLGTDWKTEVVLQVPAEAPLTVPHWLAQPPTDAMYTIADPAWRNAPDTPPSEVATFELELAGVAITVQRPVQFAWTDRVHGERTHALEILPPATASFDQKGILLPEGTEARTRVTLRGPTGPVSGVLKLTAPAGITAAPSELAFSLDAQNPELVVDVALSVSEGAESGSLAATVEVDGRSWTSQQAQIDHPHLPLRTVLQPARLALAPVALDRGGVERVGYVMGSGDVVPDVLRSVGYAVEELDEAALLSGGLSRYDAVVLGIRAYNTHPRLMALNQKLMDYVEGGGRVVVQYNTNARWGNLDGPIGPAPFAIGRGRVTDENAEMVALNPQHPALTWPNLLTPADYQGWVQERGLYFAESWDPAYTPLFSAADPGEEALEGSTLVAEHGAGVFVYTGLSFFRQLPAGVPGATRLFANLLALTPVGE